MNHSTRGRPWTLLEDERLLALAQQRWTLAGIAAALGRTRKSVEHRRAYLRRHGDRAPRRSDSPPSDLARAATALERIADILERWDRDIVQPPPPSGSRVVPLFRQRDFAPEPE